MLGQVVCQYCGRTIEYFESDRVVVLYGVDPECEHRSEPCEDED
ncbi:GapA-binding peptide SR1P [Brockia lithotrophica]|uniref:SR1 protein n=1 Tax=Brockia lithotrophica TaxID=933949 RepID=A0A660KV66_9BACL|nr:GapA-binding peptide SR1P [Brockia lithotrophica]RKQ83654.1 SR1 protein [Brockia lithotrophica]